MLHKNIGIDHPWCTNEINNISHLLPLKRLFGVSTDGMKKSSSEAGAEVGRMNDEHLV